MIENLLHLYAPDSETGQSQFEFEIAKDGYEAIEKLGGSLPDLVLLDLRLPGVSGLSVLEAIRQIDSCLPVIVVSAYGDKRTRQEAAERGANDFFQKPVSTMKLYRRIKELLAAAPRRTPAGTPKHHESETEINREILVVKYRRLNKLKERQALLGIDAPPALLIEIEDLETEIANLEQEFRSHHAYPCSSCRLD
ncbi:MAG: response regulator [Anaerolineae bacterium]|nr:response regulator [Anaerolineae bacterium]